MKITPYPQYKTVKELPQNYWDEKEREHNYAYIWYFKSEGEQYTFYHEVDYGGGSLDEVNPDIVPFNLVMIELFPYDINDLSISKERLNEFTQFRNLLNQYFYDTLSFYPNDRNRGFIDFDKTVLILPKEVSSAITNTIKEFNLTEYNDFLFYLIATIQRLYIKEIEYFQQKELQSEMRKLPKEIENLLKVVDKTNEKRIIKDRWDEKKQKIIYGYFDNKSKSFVECGKPSELKKITFHFDNEKPITINDYLLLSQITEGIVNMGGRVIHDSEEEGYAGWKEFMKNLPRYLHKEHIEKDQFKYAVTQALLRFLTEQTSLKPDADNRTSDKQIEFIISFLQFVHIYVTNKDGSINDDIKSSIDTVRGWTNKPLTPWFS